MKACLVEHSNQLITLRSSLNFYRQRGPLENQVNSFLPGLQDH